MHRYIDVSIYPKYIAASATTGRETKYKHGYRARYIPMQCGVSLHENPIFSQIVFLDMVNWN